MPSSLFFASGVRPFLPCIDAFFIGERSPFGSGAILYDIDFPSTPRPHNERSFLMQWPAIPQFPTIRKGGKWWKNSFFSAD